MLDQEMVCSMEDKVQEVSQVEDLLHKQIKAQVISQTMDYLLLIQAKVREINHLETHLEIRDDESS